MGIHLKGLNKAVLNNLLQVSKAKFPCFLFLIYY